MTKIEKMPHQPIFTKSGIQGVPEPEPAPAPVAKTVESVEEFLARGGSIKKGKLRKSRGYVSASGKLNANSSPSASERSRRAENKFSMAISRK